MASGRPLSSLQWTQNVDQGLRKDQLWQRCSGCGQPLDTSFLTRTRIRIPNLHGELLLLLTYSPPCHIYAHSTSYRTIYPSVSADFVAKAKNMAQLPSETSDKPPEHHDPAPRAAPVHHAPPYALGGGVHVDAWHDAAGHDHVELHVTDARADAARDVQRPGAQPDARCRG